MRKLINLRPATYTARACSCTRDGTDTGAPTPNFESHPFLTPFTSPGQPCR
jgi:hypothetical protein